MYGVYQECFSRNYTDMQIFYYQLALTVGENNMKETVAQVIEKAAY
ncbi:MAG: hypothetical protein GDA48_19725 [Hormoscilla sp. GM102CHS1]|nr:hypothetical protein [Hormoscilla sp. GM102CHS1]